MPTDDHHDDNMQDGAQREPRQFWSLEWYEQEGDDFVGDEDLDIAIESLQSIFSEPSVDELMCGIYAIGPDEAAALQPHVEHQIDLAKYSYFLAGHAEIGYRTPIGWAPAPKFLAAFPDATRIKPRERIGDE